MDVDVITIATFRLGSARSLQSLIQISSGVTLSIASGRTSILKLSLHSATWLQLLISSANSWPAPKEPCQGIDNDDKANSTGDLEGWRAQGTVYWSRTSCCSCWSLCRNCDFILRSCQIYVTPPI
nr:PREDICTED: uncharacterized protein LOC104219052 [Nicotiana sylvestris]